MATSRRKDLSLISLYASRYARFAFSIFARRELDSSGSPIQARSLCNCFRRFSVRSARPFGRPDLPGRKRPKNARSLIAREKARRWAPEGLFLTTATATPPRFTARGKHLGGDER